MKSGMKTTTVPPSVRARNRRLWKEKMQKRGWWIVVLAAVLLVIGGLVGYGIYDVLETQRLDAESVELIQELEIPFGTEVRVSELLERLDGELVEDVEIETAELGEQEVNFEYINIRGRKRPYSFVVKVVDQTVPVIYGLGSYTVERGYTGDLTDLMLSGDDLDDRPMREIMGEYNLDKAGRYELEYVIRDASGNESRQKFTLNVVEPSKDGDGVTNATEDAGLRYDFSDVVRDHKTEKTRAGIDVSYWQGEIDWRKVKQAGVEFAFIRLGYQVGYGGEYVVDKCFQRNIEGALKAGLPVGVYFYSYADSLDEAERQAKWVMEQVAGYELELGVAFDWENWKEFNQAGMSLRTINLVAKKFLDVAAEHGYRGWLYGSKNYLEKIWQPLIVETVDGAGVWLAQYYDRVTYGGRYGIWQLADTGRVDGVQGAVDIDVWYL